MVVMSMIGLVAGLVLAGSAIIAPQPARYIVGVLLVALSAAVLFYRWRRRRAEKVGSRWRFRVRVGGLSAVLAVLIAGVAIVVPWQDRQAEIDSGVIWRAERIPGQVVVVDGTVLRTDAQAGEVSDAVNLADGSVGWSVPDGRWVTSAGDVIAADADGLRSYSSAG